jgi:uncharacterized protein (DUF1800 family)
MHKFEAMRLPLLLAMTLASSLTLTACGGGGGGGGGDVISADTPPVITEPPPPAVVPISASEASRFLSQASFGPDSASINAVAAEGLEQWFQDQLTKPASRYLETVLAGLPEDGNFLQANGQPIPEIAFLTSDAFWQNAIKGEDQLRQRMAYALSQILVVSAEGTLDRASPVIAHYADILTEGAFGNYRDLLESVTYSPAMAIYLTYIRNEKADPTTGRVPDENFARELLQLFTIGLVALNPDGTPVTNADGSLIELYDNSDITELAKVFTGLSFSGGGFKTSRRILPISGYYTPLSVFDEFHSNESKTFLNASIPEFTPGTQSIDMALDAIFAHPNVGPFLGRQLIQRFVTSAPTPAYVQRVANAFDSGVYVLPSDTIVGSRQRGDLSAVIAAILFDPEARDEAARENSEFGKLREPILRFTHWARAFEINSADASNEALLRNSDRKDLLGQHPYRSPSVFNFYRPGYIALGTETGAAGLTAPELQITNAGSIVGYANFMTTFALRTPGQQDNREAATFIPNYAPQAALAADTDLLLNNLDLLLTHGTLQAETRTRIKEILASLDSNVEGNLLLRAQVASVLVMTSPEYLVLR